MHPSRHVALSLRRKRQPRYVRRNKTPHEGKNSILKHDDSNCVSGAAGWGEFSAVMRCLGTVPEIRDLNFLLDS